MLLADSPELQFTNDEPPAEYWLETRRPFCNLVFLLPLLIAYESGVGFASGQRGESIRNGADAWIRHWMHQAGIEIVWLLPVLLIGTLMAWHMTTRQPWRMAWDTLGGMAAESLLYAFLLIMLGQLTDYGFRHAPLIHLQVDQPSQHGFLIRLVTFMGAGIYEEFLFRLCLLPVTYALFRAAMVPKGWAITGTVITTSFIFSLAHYLGPTSDGQALAIIAEAVTRVQSSRELWFGFAFRTLAGMFFAALYFLRGFGITVGAHAAYDVFVGVILVSEI
ncbi:MAG: CPBP family intramembrane glutamic endopeptidase [Schlesneria sp.]